MQIKYQIFELRVIEEKVTFAGYSDGYGRETEKIYGLVIPSWASWASDSEEDAIEKLKKYAEDFTEYEIKKVYRSED